MCYFHVKLLLCLSANRAAGSRRRRPNVGRSRRSTLANQLILNAAVIAAATSPVTVPAQSVQTLETNVTMPLQFIHESTAEAVPVKRKRERLLEEPFHEKSLALGKAMMKRDRLLQQIWAKPPKNNEANRAKVKSMLVTVNQTVETLQAQNMSAPTADQVFSCSHEMPHLLYFLLSHIICFIIFSVGVRGLG